MGQRRRSPTHTPSLPAHHAAALQRGVPVVEDVALDPAVAGHARKRARGGDALCRCVKLNSGHIKSRGRVGRRPCTQRARVAPCPPGAGLDGAPHATRVTGWRQACGKEVWDAGRGA